MGGSRSSFNVRTACLAAEKLVQSLNLDIERGSKNLSVIIKVVARDENMIH